MSFCVICCAQGRTSAQFGEPVCAGYNDTQTCSQCFSVCGTSSFAPVTAPMNASSAPASTSSTPAPCVCPTCPTCVCSAASFVNDCTPGPTSTPLPSSSTSATTLAPTSSASTSWPTTRSVAYYGVLRIFSRGRNPLIFPIPYVRIFKRVPIPLNPHKTLMAPAINVKSAYGFACSKHTFGSYQHCSIHERIQADVH